MKWHARADGASVLLLCNSFLQAATGRGGGVGKPSEMNKAVPGYADTAFVIGHAASLFLSRPVLKGGTYATRHVSI